MKHTLILLILLSGINAARAEPSMGRLFFTPKQRAALDQARLHSTSFDAANEAVPDNITLNGVIKRSDGQHIVWINQRAFSDQSTIEHVTVTKEKNSGRYTVQLPYSDKRVQLKVGQSMDAASGKIDEAYRNRPAPSQTKPDEASPSSGNHTATTRSARNKNEPDEVEEKAAD